LPPLKFLVDDFALLEVSKICREVVKLLPRLRVFVCDGNLDDGEGVEDVKL
jgi:hypothetical protein